MVVADFMSAHLIQKRKLKLSTTSGTTKLQIHQLMNTESINGIFRTFWVSLDCHLYFLVYLPIRMVAEKMSINGIQVPRMLSNITKLFCMTKATRKKSIAIVIPRNKYAVCRGDVYANRLK